MTEDERKQKITEAKAKYGRKFAHEVRVPRKTEPSIVLREIMRKSAQQNNVTKIKRKA